MTTNDGQEASGNVKLAFIIKRFSQHSGEIAELFEKNNSFRSLCEDYRDCAKALKHWSESTSEEAPARQEEYTRLLRALEKEVLLYLGK